MTNIDWRAFWTSFATVMLVLLFFFIVVNPVIDKYNIKVVNPNPKPNPNNSGNGTGTQSKAAA